jgi:hypothetical protein
MKKASKPKAKSKAKKSVKASVLRDLKSSKNPKGGQRSKIKSDGASCMESECC